MEYEMKQTDEQVLEDVMVCFGAVETGVFGLVVKALTQEEGPAAAQLTVNNVREGRGVVECMVRLHAGGSMIEGSYVSHGARSHLFTINTNPPKSGDTTERIA
jgi:hypothetical protein